MGLSHKKNGPGYPLDSRLWDPGFSCWSGEPSMVTLQSYYSLSKVSLISLAGR